MTFYLTVTLTGCVLILAPWWAGYLTLLWTLKLLSLAALMRKMWKKRVPVGPSFALALAYAKVRRSASPISHLTSSYYRRLSRGLTSLWNTLTTTLTPAG